MQLFLKNFFLLIMLVGSVTVQSVETEKYYENGALQFEYSYRNNKLQGVTKEYYETGEIRAEHYYNRGKLIGKKEFLRNGYLRYELKYKGNNKVETHKQYYSTGELFREQTFVNGKLEGLEIDYYRNTQKKAERNYIDGKKEGSAKGYHINGNLQGDWLFKNGEPVSATIFYNTGEKWLIHTDFDNKGRLNGTSKEYNKEGKLMAIRYYENDEMVKRKRISPWLRWLWW